MGSGWGLVAERSLCNVCRNRVSLISRSNPGHHFVLSRISPNLFSFDFLSQSSSAWYVCQIKTSISRAMRLREWLAFAQNPSNLLTWTWNECIKALIYRHQRGYDWSVMILWSRLEEGDWLTADSESILKISTCGWLATNRCQWQLQTAHPTRYLPSLTVCVAARRKKKGWGEEATDCKSEALRPLASFHAWLAGAPSRDTSLKLLNGSESKGICGWLECSQYVLFATQWCVENIETFIQKHWKKFKKKIDQLAADCRLSSYEFCISAPAKTCGKKGRGERETDKKLFLPQIVTIQSACPC